jgi:hypothetical protein
MQFIGSDPFNFLARVSEKVRPLFIQLFNHPQKLINYRIDTALLCVLFCVFLYLSVQKLLF